jgi:hypothetical protein
MPNKNIKLEYSLLNCGAIILENLQEIDTISSLWEKARLTETMVNYEKFVLTMDYLFLIDVIRMDNGMIVRCRND